ncbi:MAG TPA: hypothetical protein VF992_07485 [Thermoplasmata archaeon]
MAVLRFTPRTAYSLFALAHAIGGFAILIEMTGGDWDIRWHIRRLVEVFWTPPHTVLYSGLAVAFASAFGAVFMQFLGPVPPRTLRIGIRVALVGLVMQLVAGGFDTWWHATYGVDDALSPPHVLLIDGMVVSGFGFVSGLVVLARAPAFWATAVPKVRPLLYAAMPVAFVALFYALWGFTWVFTYPGFTKPAFLPEVWQRSVVGMLFATLLPFVALSAARLVPWWGGATATLTVVTIDVTLVDALMGSPPDPASLSLGLALILVPAALIDFIVRRYPSERARRVTTPLLGIAGGVLGGFFAGGPVVAMTGGIAANPAWFPLLFAVGGVIGAFASVAFTRRVDALLASSGSPPMLPVAASANGGTGRRP